MSSKDTHDPGWNDPPIFTFDKAAAIQAAAATKKGNVLNKRVAFPLNNNMQTTKSGTPPVMDLTKPPPMSLPQATAVPSQKPTVITEKKNDMSSEERLKKVIENLEIERNCNDEIVKRIKVMEKMWTDGKLEDIVQIRILELSEALSRGDTETADRIQMSLMVDYVSQCSSWMSGIRHLINKKKI